MRTSRLIGPPSTANPSCKINIVLLAIEGIIRREFQEPPGASGRKVEQATSGLSGFGNENITNVTTAPVSTTILHFRSFDKDDADFLDFLH